MKVAHLFPGQGSQSRGMGARWFEAFPALLERADRVLSWSVRELCLSDPHGRLDQTEFTQPALYVVNALAWYAARRDGQPLPDLVAGHSLGEYNALLAAGVFDFETGLSLVRRRGELMSKAREGGMAVIVGLPCARVQNVLEQARAHDVDVANFNAPTQTVVSGPRASLERLLEPMRAAGARRAMLLNVSAAFHSRYMSDAAEQFAVFLRDCSLARPQIPVLSNVTGRPYGDDVRAELIPQIRSSVRWTDSMQYLLAAGVDTVVEIGPGRVLTNLFEQIRREAPSRALDAAPAAAAQPAPERPPATPPALQEPPPARLAPRSLVGSSVAGGVAERAEPGGVDGRALGSAEFRAAYGVRYAYAAGSMYKGIASRELVARMANAQLLAFLGTGGMQPSQVDRDIRWLERNVPPGRVFGMNLLANYEATEAEMELAQLYLRHRIPVVEASAFMQITPGLALYRFKQACRGPDGRPQAPNRLIAKVSRPEVARAFMLPPPERVLARLAESGLLTAQEVDAARLLPVATDITVEADSGGHTDRGNPYALMPALLALRREVHAERRYAEPIRLGAAGGIGSPAAAAAALMLGADYLVTGSINQCTPEAGTSEAVKELLAALNVQDTDYAPAGDLFEMGSLVQVVKRGLFFPARANKLRDLYQRHDSLDDIDPATRAMIERKYFRRSLEEIWEETARYLASERPGDLAKAERNPKQRMALTFKWYFGYTTRLALAGDENHKVDYQVHCGPAMGAFNQVVKGTALEPWRARHVDAIAEFIMEGASEVVTGFQRRLAGALPSDARAAE